MLQTLSRRERKKLETREALLEAAAALFHARGYDETTIEEITDKADVAKGTFFNYFSSKEELLSELALWSLEQLRAALDIGTGAPASPVARLKLLMRLMYDHASRDIEFSQRAFAARLCTPPPAPHASRWIHGLFSDLVSEAQNCGEIRPDADPEWISDLLRLFFFRQMRIFAYNKTGLPPADYFEHTIDLLMDGLAGPNWRRQ
jgi:AcrR family transcriptional regulator